MDLKQLQYFVAAADEGSISGAARRLFITQPPVSVQIQQLEKELGGPLVIRGGRRLELTPAGHELYRHATLLLALSRVAAEDVRAVQSGQHGVLRLGVVSSVGCAMAADWLADFCREQPDIDCELTEANTYELLEKLRAHVIDLCIARRPFPDEGYASVLLQSEELMQFASPAFPISNGWGTLSDQPLITSRRWESILRRQIEDRALTLRLRCLCDDARTAISMCERDMGVCVAPASALALLRRTDMRVHPLPGNTLRSEIVLIYLPGQPLCEAAMRFKESLLLKLGNWDDKAGDAKGTPAIQETVGTKETFLS